MAEVQVQVHTHRSLSNPAVQQEFKTRLGDISASLNSLQHYIDLVTKTLSEDPCVADLLERWNQDVSKKFSSKRWKLKESSAEFDGLIEKLANTHLPQVPGYLRLLPGADVAESLGEFHSEFRDFDKKAHKQAHRFEKLHGAVDGFKNRCNDFGKEHEGEINTLRDDIARLHKEREEILAQLREKEGRLDKLQSILRTLRQPRLIINHFIHARLTQVIGRLGVFHSIWSAGDKDVHDLTEYVKEPRRDSIPLPLSLYQHHGTPVYGVVRKSLQSLALSALPHHNSHLDIDDILEVALSQHADHLHIPVVTHEQLPSDESVF